MPDGCVGLVDWVNGMRLNEGEPLSWGPTAATCGSTAGGPPQATQSVPCQPKGCVVAVATCPVLRSRQANHAGTTGKYDSTIWPGLCVTSTTLSDFERNG